MIRPVSKWCEQYRVRKGARGSTEADGNNGGFTFTRHGVVITVLISDGEGWEHVSVSTAARCPTWDEMCWVKDLFFGPNEAVMQVHPPKSDYVNYHPYCLHMWKPDAGFPMPHYWMVGPKDGQSMEEALEDSDR